MFSVSHKSFYVVALSLVACREPISLGKKIIDKMEGKGEREAWRKRKREQQLYRETGREAWRKRRREQQLCIGKPKR